MLSRHVRVQTYPGDSRFLYINLEWQTSNTDVSKCKQETFGDESDPENWSIKKSFFDCCTSEWRLDVK